jgi:hypothetical protein
MGPDKEVVEVARDLPTADPAAVQAKLAKANVFHIVNRPGPDPSISMVYFSARCPDAAGTPNGTTLLVEITFKAGTAAARVVVKSPSQDIGRVAVAGLVAVLKA